MEISLEKMGIRIGIKRSENQWLLNFDFEDFFDMDYSCNAVSFSSSIGHGFVWFFLLEWMWKYAGNVGD